MALFGRARAERLKRQTMEAYEKGVAYQRFPEPQFARSALTAFGEAGRSLLLLMEQNRLDPELWHMRGALLYSTASSEIRLGLHSDAVETLVDCEDAYKYSQHPDKAVLIADVIIRRARAHSELGSPLSALADVDAAIAAYVKAGAFASPHPLLADFARVLAVAATIHLKVGDSDQALACAQQSLARYQELVNAQGSLAVVHADYALNMAANTASQLEAARSDWNAALAVDAFLLEGAEKGQGPLGATLARQGLHLRLAGQTVKARQVLARAEEVTPGSLAREEEIAALALPPTLTQALTMAESLMRDQKQPTVPPHEVRRLHGKLTAEESYSASSRLTNNNAFPDQAGQLVTLADLLLREGKVAESWRIAVETHLMCLGAVRHIFVRAQRWESGLADHWCGALEVGARAVLVTGEPSLLLDLRKTIAAVSKDLGSGGQGTHQEILNTAGKWLDLAARRTP